MSIRNYVDIYEMVMIICLKSNVLHNNMYMNCMYYMFLMVDYKGEIFDGLDEVRIWEMVFLYIAI